jgi:NADPH:quinone reductase-like Zn-dependent oxidoreductase
MPMTGRVEQQVGARPSVGTMRAVTHTRYGDAGSLEVGRMEVPSVVPGRVLVSVAAGSLNPADKFMMLGRPAAVRIGRGLLRPHGVHRIPGHDLAGVVAEVGQGVTGFRIGDRVFGSAAGALADYAMGKATAFALMPGNLSFDQAAALPMAGLAALHALRDSARLEPGERLLINGAAGGIGTFAIQLGKTMGAHVTAVCSTRNVDLVRELGADAVVDYTREAITGLGDRYDVILDNVANHPFAALTTLLTPSGRVITNSGEPGPDGGAIVRFLKAAVLARLRRLPLRSYLSTVRADDLAALASMVERGELRPVIDGTYPFERAAEAMAQLATRHARGKVIVALDGVDGHAPASAGRYR